MSDNFDALLDAASQKDPTLFLENFNEMMSENVNEAINQYLINNSQSNETEVFLAENDNDEPLDIGGFINEMYCSPEREMATNMMGELQAKSHSTMGVDYGVIAPVPKPFNSDALGKQDNVGHADPKKSIKQAKTVMSMRNNNKSVQAKSSDAVGTPNKDIEGMPKDEFFVPYGS